MTQKGEEEEEEKSTGEQSGEQSVAEKIQKAILKLKDYFVVNPLKKSEVDVHVRMGEDRQRLSLSFQNMRNNHGLKNRIKQEA